MVKAEPGQQSELDALKAKVADLQEQLAGSLPVDDELRAVIAEASEAAAAATPAPAAPAPAPVAEAPAPVAVDAVPPVDVPAAPVAEATEGGEPAPADKPV